MHIALNMGYLAQEGLDVTAQPHAFGKLALEAVIEGQADLATVGDTVCHEPPKNYGDCRNSDIQPK